MKLRIHEHECAVHAKVEPKSARGEDALDHDKRKHPSRGRNSASVLALSMVSSAAAFGGLECHQANMTSDLHAFVHHLVDNIAL